MGTPSPKSNPPPTLGVACPNASPTNRSTTVSSRSPQCLNTVVSPGITDTLGGLYQSGAHSHYSANSPPAPPNGSETFKGFDSYEGSESNHFSNLPEMKTLQKATSAELSPIDGSKAVASNDSPPSKTTTPAGRCFLPQGTKRTLEDASYSSRVVKRKTQMSNGDAGYDHSHLDAETSKRSVHTTKPKDVRTTSSAAAIQSNFSLAGILAEIEGGPQQAAKPNVLPKKTFTRPVKVAKPPVKTTQPTTYKPVSKPTPPSSVDSSAPPNNSMMTPPKKRDIVQPKSTINKKFTKAAGAKLPKANKATGGSVMLSSIATKLTPEQIAARKEAREAARKKHTVTDG